MKSYEKIHGQLTTCWPQVSPKAIQFAAEDEERAPNDGYDGLVAASADQWWDGYDDLAAESADQWWDGFLPKNWLYGYGHLLIPDFFGEPEQFLPSYLYVVQSSSQATRMSNGIGLLLQSLVDLRQPFAQVSWPNLRRYLDPNICTRNLYQHQTSVPISKSPRIHLWNYTEISIAMLYHVNVVLKSCPKFIRQIVHRFSQARCQTTKQRINLQPWMGMVMIPGVRMTMMMLVVSWHIIIGVEWSPVQFELTPNGTSSCSKSSMVSCAPQKYHQLHMMIPMKMWMVNHASQSWTGIFSKTVPFGVLAFPKLWYIKHISC